MNFDKIFEDAENKIKTIAHKYGSDPVAIALNTSISIESRFKTIVLLTSKGNPYESKIGKPARALALYGEIDKANSSRSTIAPFHKVTGQEFETVVKYASTYGIINFSIYAQTLIEFLGETYPDKTNSLSFGNDPQLSAKFMEIRDAYRSKSVVIKSEWCNHVRDNGKVFPNIWGSA